MELHKILDECINHFEIKGKELAERAGRGEGNISKIRNGKVGITIKEFVKLIDVCEQMEKGFKQEFARRLGANAHNVATTDLSLGEIAEQIYSGRLSDDEVAKISVELADVIVAISKRVKSPTRSYSVV